MGLPPSFASFCDTRISSMKSCHDGPALLRFWFQTNHGRENSAGYLKIQAGKTFSYQGHALVTLYVQFLCPDWAKFDFGWHRFRFSPCLMRIEEGSKFSSDSGVTYPANRVSFDLRRWVGKRKEPLPTSPTIHIEHAPNSNFSATSIKPLP